MTQTLPVRAVPSGSETKVSIRSIPLVCRLDETVRDQDLAKNDRMYLFFSPCIAGGASHLHSRWGLL